MKEKLVKFGLLVGAVVVGNFVYDLLADEYNERVHDFEDLVERAKDKVDDVIDVDFGDEPEDGYDAP